MLSIAGSIGVGLVSGWAAARLLSHARWWVIARVLLGLAVQGMVVLGLASARGAIAFGGALALGVLLGLLWVRRLELRYGAAG